MSTSTDMSALVRRHRRALHAIAAVLVLGCAVATWWQVERARGGNFPSYFYMVLWPFYGGYVLFLWRRLRRPPRPRAAGDPVPPPAEDAELIAYNRYLAARRDEFARRPDNHVRRRAD